jgi:hypothetical protein
MQPVSIFAKVLRENLARSIGGGNDAWGQVVLLSHVRPFILPDGRAGGADYNPLRRATVLPIVAAALYASSCIFIRHHNI